ncbi:MAG: AAA family ATPase [Oscillospiraceae bacterium]|nr:AAA family ATPase [Oscillospiraceae bacterium]
MPVKINTLEVENVKRVKAVTLEPSANGLTILGGNNGQGKTSVLDAICWAVGGNKFKPTNASRDGAYTDPHIRITLSNGLVVERSGKNAALKVIDPQGNKSGQTLLDSFISELALNLPKFLNASDREKADTLLQIIGVGDQLMQMEQEEKRLYEQRHAIGQIADQKKKFAAELPSWQGVPEQPVTASELILQQQEILRRNAENQRLRSQLAACEDAVVKARTALEEAKHVLAKAEYDAAQARKSAKDLQDESTAEIEQSIAEIDAVNAKVRDNIAKAQAEQEADGLSRRYEALTNEIECIRTARRELLNGANLPLPGLSVECGRLLYQGKAWDCMSGSEQLRVATAIVRCLNPDCGFVLLDKLEQMDMQTLADFGAWLEANGLQAIATRVSTGDECSVIIEDGRVAPTQASCLPMPSGKGRRDTSNASEEPPRYVPGWKQK